MRKVEFDFQEMYRLISDNPFFEIIGFTTGIFDEILYWFRIGLSNISVVSGACPASPLRIVSL